jgi:DNA ligase-1
MNTSKPMLAGKAPKDLSELTYPVLASPKLDGIRALIRDGQVVSRAMKLIPNVNVRAALEGIPDGVDGELMVEGGFKACSSAFMSKSKPVTDFWYFVFDWDITVAFPDHPDSADCGFDERLAKLTNWSENQGHNNMRVVEHVLIDNAEDLALYEAKCLEEGFEGVMVRDPEGLYKHGRSTTREGGLLKIKQFADEEMTVTGFVELMHNDNEATKDAFGRTKRSTSKEGKRPAGVMGVMVGETTDGAIVELGTGFTAEEREVMWNTRDSLLGRLVKFKHLPDPGGRLEGQRPRHPVYLGFRATEDIS